MQLPQPVTPPASPAASTDVRAVGRTATATVAADGTAVAAFPVVEAGTYWLVDRVVIIGAGGGTAYLYDDPTLPAEGLLDGTSAGDFDVSEYPRGLLIDETRTLVAHWSGATPGNTATIRAQVRIVHTT